MLSDRCVCKVTHPSQRVGNSFCRPTFSSSKTLWAFFNSSSACKQIQFSLTKSTSYNIMTYYTWTLLKSIMFNHRWLTHLHHLAVILHSWHLQCFNVMTSTVIVNEFPTSFGHTCLKHHRVLAFKWWTINIIKCSLIGKQAVTLRSGNCCRYSSRFRSVESTSLLWKSSHNASQSCKITHIYITTTQGHMKTVYKY